MLARTLYSLQFNGRSLLGVAVPGAPYTVP